MRSPLRAYTSKPLSWRSRLVLLRAAVSAAPVLGLPRARDVVRLLVCGRHGPIRGTAACVGKSMPVPIAGTPTLPDAYRAAARLGCQETFALVSDERAQGIRRVWLAEQVDLARYELREQLGEDWVGRELQDKFAMLYMQCAEHNVNWYVIRQGAPDMEVEIRDEYGGIICKKFLRMRDAYTKGPAMSEAAFVAKGVGDVVWVEICDAQGNRIAETPASITARAVDADGVEVSLSGDDDRARDVLAKSASAIVAGLQTMGASPAAAQGVGAALTRKRDKIDLAFRWDGDPQAPTGSACASADGSIKLFTAIDSRDDEDEDDEDE